MGKQKRFEVVRNEAPSGGGIGMSTTILRDTVTGVLYFMVVNGYGGGLTPLLNADGTPIVWNDGDDMGVWK